AEQLRWGGGWLEALPWSRRFGGLTSSIAHDAACLDLLAAVGEQPRLLGMLIAVANDLTSRLHCDRVSVGVARSNGAIRVRAMSNSATFKDQSRLVDAIENAMEEAAAQRCTGAYPPLGPAVPAITTAPPA